MGTYEFPKRESKYKVRDIQKQERYEPVYEAYKGNLNELLLNQSGQLIRRTMTGTEHESVFEGRYKVVRYTGLKDKNRVEIYEGDIVSGLHGTPKITIVRRNYYKRSVYSKEEDAYYNPTHRDIGEIIGNIFENSELLEAPHETNS